MEQHLLSTIRILIVDDYKDWRRQVLSLFQTRSEWRVIAEAADGTEAVQKAAELKPDLTVLDIGLPKLNGIEAARQIRQLSRGSKILFLSQNNDLDVVRAALSTAQGYVHKADFRVDFLPAIQALLQDQLFVSSSLRGYEFTGTAGAKVPHRHEVQFYSDDGVFLDKFAHFIVAGLKSGRAAIAFITESHRKGLVSRLQAHGLDVDGATHQGTYIQLDVAQTLSTFMVNGMPDTARFFEVASGLIKAAAKTARQEHRGVAVCGECSPTLWAEGKADAAIRLEHLFDQVGKTFGLDILCGYPLSSFHGQEDERVFHSICAQHSAVISE